MNPKARILTEAETRDETVARLRSGNPITDLLKAWADDQGKPMLHASKQQIIRREIPLLADALDRLTTKKK